MPILDTGFVVAKRIKYRRPIYQADRWHFHHRLANIGFSQRRTLAYLYGWTLVLAAWRWLSASSPTATTAAISTPSGRRDGRPRAGGRGQRLRVFALEILKLRRLRRSDRPKGLG